MALTETSLYEVGPSDDEFVRFDMSGRWARQFVAMLNMNKIRNGQGWLIVFSWERSGDTWILMETSYTER